MIGAIRETTAGKRVGINANGAHRLCTGSTMPEDFSVAVYYGARSHIESRELNITGTQIGVSIPLSLMPRKLAATRPGDRLRLRLRGGNVKASPVLDAFLVEKHKTVGRYWLRLEIVDWNKLARYWRSAIEAPGGGEPGA